jgi:nitrogen regulatory protein PII
VKKIEAIIDPAVLDAVKLYLAQAGIDGRLTVTEVSGLENFGRFYQHETTAENPWKPCLRIDLIVSDRQTESAVNIILRQANLAGRRGTAGYINILSLDATLEISTEKLRQPFKEKTGPSKKELKPTRDVRPAFTPEGSKQESVRQRPEES